MRQRAPVAMCGLLAAALACGTSVLAQPSQPAPVPRGTSPDQWRNVGPSRNWFERLAEWVSAARAHRTGAMDVHVATAASITRAQLFAILADLHAVRGRLVRAHRHARTRGVEREIDYGGRRLATRAIQLLLGIDDDGAAAGNLNDLIERGAILHTDVAYHAPPALAAAATSNDASMLLMDGLHVGYEYSALHWEFARLLLDLIFPSASADPDVQRWYAAAGALMRRQYSYGYSAPHLQRARALFPDDATAQFQSGCLHEAMASARVQSYVRFTSWRPAGVSSADDELRRAEVFFKRALELSPDAVEARIRRGRVLGLLGRPADAAGELSRALQETADPLLVYFGALFLGDAEQALGRREQAQTAYEKALALFPEAQSVHLALGQLARRFGDRQAALTAMDQLFELPDRAELRQDPWWKYFEGTVESDESLLMALWNALGRQERP